MSMTAPIRPLYQAQTYRTLLFLSMAIPIAAAALALLIAGWRRSASSRSRHSLVPVLLGFRAVIGLLSRGDAALARATARRRSGTPVDSAGRGFWGRATAVFLHPCFWRQQAYLALRLTVGFAPAVGVLSLIAGAFGGITLPISYRWTDTTTGLGRSTRSGARSCSSRPASSPWSSPHGWPGPRFPVGLAGAVAARTLAGGRPASRPLRLRRRALRIDSASPAVSSC